jgi:hypothetical protein
MLLCMLDIMLIHVHWACQSRDAYYRLHACLQVKVDGKDFSTALKDFNQALALTPGKLSHRYQTNNHVVVELPIPANCDDMVSSSFPI